MVESNKISSVHELDNLTGSPDGIHAISDTVLKGFLAASKLTLNNSDVFSSAMNEIIGLPVQIVAHVPKSVRRLLAEVLAGEFYHAHSNGLSDFLRLSAFAKAVLRLPPQGGRKKRVVINSLLAARLRQWQNGDLMNLWQEARLDADARLSRDSQAECLKQSTVRRAINLAREGRFSLAMRNLGSQGCASYNNSDTLAAATWSTPS